ncbi:MAG TPA: M23 family metallopeptidase [Prolixibacteraceae bacterium]|jgi:murein DD-endopeptidase MepM/ murein hydrolase activator NlpD|nr:M23 family metallopeptidase [Prolixibacteraceae bacterium]
MGKINYRFNPDTLSFDKIERNVRSLIKKILGYLSTGIVSGIIFFFIFLQFFETPVTKKLKRENEQLLSQFSLMNKDIEKISKALEDIQMRDDNIYRVIFEANPVPSSVRMAGFGGANRYTKLESMDNSELIVSTAKKLDILSKQVYVQSKSYEEVIKMALGKEKMLASIPSIMPVSNRDLKRTASGWGMRMHPIYRIPRFHYGMDFTAPTGTDIFATGNGIVKEVERNAGYGNTIVIDHGYGYETLYGHLSRSNVKVGQTINRGDIIGFVGSSGASTSPHLHYEVMKNGQKVNPQNYYFQDLNPEEYEKMISISSNTGQSFD